MKKEMTGWHLRRLPAGTRVRLVRNGEKGGTIYTIVRKRSEKYLKSIRFGITRPIDCGNGEHYELLE